MGRDEGLEDQDEGRGVTKEVRGERDRA